MNQATTSPTAAPASAVASAALDATGHDPLIVAVAPNGAYKLHKDHPAVPLTADALAQTAKACLDAGASMLHMHIREADGRHLLDAQAYRDAVDVVTRAVGDEMVIQVTSEAAGRYQAAEQIAVMRALRPRAVSVGLREIDKPDIGEAGLAAFFAWLVRERAMTQVILYDVADVNRWHDLRSRGVVPDAPWFVLFVLGRYSAGQTSRPTDLLPFLAAHDSKPEPWAVCAFGATENACMTAAAALGGHARVGFENNLLCKDGTRAPDNAALVQQVVESARALGRPLATAADIRARFTPT